MDISLKWQYWYFESRTRYYRVILSENLFGNWIITKQWGGRFNSINGKKEYLIDNLDKLNSTIIDTFKKRLKKGYQLKYQSL